MHEKVFDNRFEIVRRGCNFGQAKDPARAVQLMYGLVERIEFFLATGAFACSNPQRFNLAYPGGQLFQIGSS